MLGLRSKLMDNAIFIVLLGLPLAIVWGVFGGIIESVESKKAENTLRILRIVVVVIILVWIIYKFK